MSSLHESRSRISKRQEPNEDYEHLLK